MSPDRSRAQVDRERYARIKEAFLAVAEVAEEERPAALGRACGDDAALRSAVQALLEGATQRTPFDPAIGPGATPPEPAIVGSHVGSIRVDARIAEGGMGSIYRGFDERLHRLVALKAIRGEWRQHPVARLRFLREAAVLGQLKHPGICEIYRYEQTADTDYLVLEYIDGKSLTQAMAGPLTADERDRIGATIAGVLRAAHASGIVHRDLKPDNVMVTAEGAVKVIDFGIAHAESLIDDEALLPVGSIPLGEAASGGLSTRLHTRTGDIMGTPRYMPPEQARGEAPTPASDIFSLGLILHELSTGQSAYPADLRGPQLLERLRAGTVELAQELSGPRRRLIERMLSIDPGARPTAAEVAGEFQRIADLPRRRRRIALGLMALVLAASGAVGYLTTIRAERTRAETARVQAERLVNLLLDELFDELFVRERLDVAERVSREVLRYFEDLPEPLRQLSARRMSRALYAYANAQWYRGNLRAARETIERKLRLDEKSAAEVATPEALAEVARDLASLAKLEENDASAAASLARRAVAIYDRLVREQPGEERWQVRLADGLTDLGAELIPAGDLQSAMDAFAQADRSFRRLLAADPSSERWRHKLGNNQNMLGWAHFLRAELPAAIVCYRESIRIFDALTAESPKNATARGLAAEARLGLSQSLLRQGDLSGAFEAIEEARELLAHNLRVEDPNPLRWTDVLRETAIVSARILRKLGKVQAARERLERAAFARPSLEDPDAATQNNLVQWAEIELELGHVAEARPVVERIVHRGWHLQPGNEELAALARRAGLIP